MPFPFPFSITSNSSPLFLLLILPQQLILIGINNRILAPSPRKAIPRRIRPPIIQSTVPPPPTAPKPTNAPPQTPHQQRHRRRNRHQARQRHNGVFDPRLLAVERASAVGSTAETDTADFHAAVPVGVDPIADAAGDGAGEQHDEDEEPEAAEAVGGFFFFPVFFVAGAGFGGGCELELAAAFAGAEGDAAVAGWEVVVGLGGVFLAFEGVVGGREVLDEVAGAVGLAFVVVVAGKGLSVLNVDGGRGWGIGLPFEVSPGTRAIRPDWIELRQFMAVVAVRFRVLADVLRYVAKKTVIL